MFLRDLEQGLDRDLPEASSDACAGVSVTKPESRIGLPELTKSLTSTGPQFPALRAPQEISGGREREGQGG